ncbi:MBL fold metallo-hydrolase [Candidatus Berkelbacteria bacterium]|nr:MBL fold metallo-hydrolase [Candidatus Berkelbacteria bacterium]
MAQLGFYGSAGIVTGSNFLVEDSRGTKIVVDCGLFQGDFDANKLNAQPFAYKAAEVSAVVLTHAHLDHIGRLPILVKDGFRGKIFATSATLELTQIVLKDAYDVMLSNHEQDGAPLLYDQPDIKRTFDLMQAMPYKTRTEIASGIFASLYDAGHILGSASVLIEADGKKILFSGDIGHAPSTLLPHAQTPELADAIVTEATYGGVDRTLKHDRLTVLHDAVNWIVQNRGVLLIPAFSVERSQELLYLFNHLYNQHKLPKVPIFLDSPLAIEALEVFERHQQLFKKDVQQERQTDTEIFDFKGLFLTPTSAESKEINDTLAPKVIIAGSGMMAGGRIMHHLKRYLSRKDCLLLVIGYQAEGTLGSKIVDGARSVFLMGDEIPIRAKVEVVDAFSGHADNKELIDWIKGVKLSPNGKVFIVHSEPDRALAFNEELELLLPSITVEVAENNKVVEI